MVIEVDLRLDLMLFHYSFWAHRFPCLSIDGHPHAVVVLFPCSLSQSVKEATMGITICLFVFLALQSVARGGSVEYMLYLPGVWLQLG
jgi:hypothetical protein